MLCMKLTRQFAAIATRVQLRQPELFASRRGQTALRQRLDLRAHRADLRALLLHQPLHREHLFLRLRTLPCLHPNRIVYCTCSGEY